MKYNKRTLVILYREWSEEQWCASFMLPNPSFVRAFREWLTELPSEPVNSFELEMVAEFERQEAEEKT